MWLAFCALFHFLCGSYKLIYRWCQLALLYTMRYLNSLIAVKVCYPVLSICVGAKAVLN